MMEAAQEGAAQQEIRGKSQWNGDDQYAVAVALKRLSVTVGNPAKSQIQNW